MIRIFILWFLSFILLFIAISLHNIYIKVILTTFSIASILYSEVLLDKEYVKYHEKKR